MVRLFEPPSPEKSRKTQEYSSTRAGLLQDSWSYSLKISKGVATLLARWSYTFRATCAHLLDALRTTVIQRSKWYPRQGSIDALRSHREPAHCITKACS